MPPSPESSPLLDAASPAPEPSPASDEPTRVPLAIEDWLTVLAMAALALITFANVLVRYFTDSSLAWAEEFSVFLMIVLSLVGGVMIAAMSRAGYPASFSASVVGAAAATDILIPPSVAFIVYSVLVPGASVPALFAAGMIPGLMAGVALIVPAVWLARRHGMGALEATMPRPAFWKSLRQAMWGLAAPVLILGGMRAGWFTPTEAAVVAVFYGLFVGMCIHRTIRVRDLFVILRESGELSAGILLVVSLAGIFAYSLSTLGVIDPITRAIVDSGLGEYGVLALLILLLITVGMFLDGVSIFLIFVPLLWPIVQFYQWDPVWFGVILTLKVALGRFTPPLAVNLMVSCRIAKVRMEETVRWVGWMLFAMFLVMVAVIAWAEYKLSLLLGPAYPWGKGGEIWANLVKERTQGRIDIKLYPGTSLVQGDQTREFTALRQGVIDLAVGSTINWSPQVKQLDLFALPFLMPDFAAIDALTQGEVGQDIFKAVDQAGVLPHAWGENGFREISNSKHAIQSPADLKGLKIRVVGSPLFLETMTALGANPTQTSWADAQPALASGAVDGQENPMAVYTAAKLHTVGQKYLTLWGYVADPLIFVVNKDIWNSWTPADREIVKQAAVDADKPLVKELTGLGVTVTQLTPAQNDAFTKATQPVYEKWKKQVGTDLVSKAEQAIAARKR